MCKLLYIGETSFELISRFNKHRYNAKSRPDNCDLAEHIHEEGHNFDKDIEVTILKQGFQSAEEREFYEDKFICVLGTY